ncbi:hypothetical protein CFH90_08885 [Acinetobacter johnsonii]|uniref:Uncharacterized protein n=1 Tax=Acinetobacter johnsonii TaxID=40214 RepID=A0A3S9AKI4_ACIJO|nr:hypothetical protein CFH90_08885 [Acinetobacter johnsonii]
MKNAPWQSFLIFWDRLLENQKLVTAYNQLKQDSQHLMMDVYRFKKAKFIESVFNQRIKNALPKLYLRTHFLKR